MAKKESWRDWFHRQYIADDPPDETWNEGLKRRFLDKRTIIIAVVAVAFYVFVRDFLKWI